MNLFATVADSDRYAYARRIFFFEPERIITYVH